MIGQADHEPVLARCGFWNFRHLDNLNFILPDMLQNISADCVSIARPVVLSRSEEQKSMARTILNDLSGMNGWAAFKRRQTADFFSVGRKQIVIRAAL